MNYYRIIVYFIIALALILSGVFIRGCFSKPDWKQSNSNAISNQKPKEVLYTVADFKKYQHVADSLALLKVVPKTRYLNKYIHLKDTIRIHDTVVNGDYEVPGPPLEESDIRFISVSKPCYSLTAICYPDTSIVDLMLNNDIQIFEYWHHAVSPFIKRVWKWNFSKVNEVKAINCNGDTMNVIDNIRIEKR